jgi:D-tagatose-1,6-bisphosphate aldolase subunit GatZ/KbaZ
MPNFLLDLSHRRCIDQQCAIYSVCSAHPWVLEAAMQRHRSSAGPLLIEATCNQVNQFGGYTGMRPANFRELVHSIAARAGFATNRLLLGGDHLGPYPWQNLPADKAMANACEMVRLFVQAGYGKIHLDTSMPCSDDQRPLPDAVIAERAAKLCAAAEGANNGSELVYVIGTEVPTPGGAVDELGLCVTRPERADEAIRLHREAFSAVGLDRVWERVIALVVQPGVEFGHETVEDYERARAAKLSALLDRHPGLIFEAHSTDYQRPEALSALVQDGFAILKVGPALTYAMRQALFALATIEDECISSSKQSHLPERMERVMLEHPEHWQKHYAGSPEQQHRLRMHSYSDRIRYYWSYPEAKRAVETLIGNLENSGIPETLLSDYLPDQYKKVRAGTLPNKPLPLVLDAIGDALDPYIKACEPSRS